MQAFHHGLHCLANGESQGIEALPGDPVSPDWMGPLEEVRKDSENSEYGDIETSGTLVSRYITKENGTCRKPFQARKGPSQLTM